MAVAIGWNHESSSFQQGDQFPELFLQNVDFKQAEDLLRTTQIKEQKQLSQFNDNMVTEKDVSWGDLDEDIKKDLCFHTEFLIKVVYTTWLMVTMINCGLRFLW